MTFSIVARDPQTGAVGVATATGGPCVGHLVPHALAEVGAIATQGDTNPYYGLDGLDLLRGGVAAGEVVARITAADSGSSRRQLIAIGITGEPGAFSGAEVQPAGGIRRGTDFVAAGNMLAGDDVLEATAQAFETATGALAERLLVAMLAGEATGGDQRGTRSAALIVCSSRPYPDLDCRVDLSETPLADLARVLERARTGPYADFLSRRPNRG